MGKKSPQTKKEESSDKKNIWFLGLVSFINDTSSKIILPILPLFIKQIGGGGFALGLVSGLGESIASLFKIVAGYWSDKTGKRKPFVFGGYSLSALFKFLFGFAESWPQVLFFKSGERLGKGLRSAPRDAILAASTKKEKRGKGFGIHRALDSAGSVLGAIVAFVLFWYLGMNFQNIFLLAGVIGFFSLVPLLFVKERGGEKKTQKGFKVSLKSLSRPLRMFILVATLFTLGNFSYMFFVLESQGSFEGKMAVGIPILLYALYNTSYSLFAVPAGILSDKIGRRKVLLAGYGLFGLACLGFMFAGSLPLFVILFLLFGLNYSLVNATQRALVSDLAEKEVRGTALGTFHMMTSLATLPGGLIAGYLWDMNSSLLFSYGAGISFLSVILFLIVCKTCQSNE